MTDAQDCAPRVEGRSSEKGLDAEVMLKYCCSFVNIYHILQRKIFTLFFFFWSPLLSPKYGTISRFAP